MAGRFLPTVGSRRMVRLALLGYCVSGPFIGLAGSLATFFLALLLWGFFQGMLDVSMNTQAIAVERLSGRVLMPGFHGSWSTGALVGALTGALAVGLGVSLSQQLLVLAVPSLLAVGWLTTRMVPDRTFRGSDSPEPASGGAAASFSVRSSCWGASLSPTCSARGPRPTGPPSTSMAPCTSFH